MIGRSRGLFTSALALAAAVSFVIASGGGADARPGFRAGGPRVGFGPRMGYRGGYYRRGYGWGPAVGVGVGLGLLGAAAAAAAASPYYGYCSVPVYDGWGNVIGYRRVYCN